MLLLFFFFFVFLRTLNSWNIFSFQVFWIIVCYIPVYLWNVLFLFQNITKSVTIMLDSNVLFIYFFQHLSLLLLTWRHFPPTITNSWPLFLPFSGMYRKNYFLFLFFLALFGVCFIIFIFIFVADPQPNYSVFLIKIQNGYSLNSRLFVKLSPNDKRKATNTTAGGKKPFKLFFFFSCENVFTEIITCFS